MADFKYARGLALDDADQLTGLNVNCRGTPRLRKHLQTTISLFCELANQESGDAGLTPKYIQALYNELSSH